MIRSGASGSGGGSAEEVEPPGQEAPQPVQPRLYPQNPGGQGGHAHKPVADAPVLHPAVVAPRTQIFGWHVPSDDGGYAAFLRAFLAELDGFLRRGGDPSSTGYTEKASPEGNVPSASVTA